MSYTTVVFDLDGTLLDTLDDLADSVNQMLENMQEPTRTRDEIASFIGHGVRHLISHSLPQGYGEDQITDCVQQMQAAYKKNMFNKTHPFEGIPELLDKLVERNMKIAVLSNKPDVHVRTLCKLHFGDIIPLAMGEIPGVPRKPSPESLQQILAELGSSSEESIYVGDSDVDIQTGINAGMLPVGVIWGLRSEQVLREAGARHILHTPDMLLDVIGRR